MEKIEQLYLDDLKVVFFRYLREVEGELDPKVVEHKWQLFLDDLKEHCSIIDTM